MRCSGKDVSLSVLVLCFCARMKGKTLMVCNPEHANSISFGLMDQFCIKKMTLSQSEAYGRLHFPWRQFPFCRRLHWLCNDVT